jgi:hypothetical protein
MSPPQKGGLIVWGGFIWMGGKYCIGISKKSVEEQASSTDEDYLIPYTLKASVAPVLMLLLLHP